MKVLYFGTYDPMYARNAIIMRGLRLAGVELVECRTSARGFAKIKDLWTQYRTKVEDCDAVIVGFLGQSVMPFAWILTRLIRRKPLIFDMFLSLYDSNVWDRKVASPYSLRAFYNFLLDAIAIRLADTVLLDTNAHIAYASKTFRISPRRFECVFIGANDEFFYPQPQAGKSAVPVVLFHGTYIPLQGVQHIIEAARILKNGSCIFRLIGSGQLKKKMSELARSYELTNIEFVDFMPPQDLRNEIAAADICLGIFGDTQKTLRVIPNKLYECLAMKKPVISADTPALRELFNESDLVLVPVSNPDILASAIKTLLKDKTKQHTLAEHGYDTFITNASPLVIGKQVREIISKLISL